MIPATYPDQSAQAGGPKSRVAFAAALGFWLYYYLVRSLLGPLQPDQLFFAHIFWMLRHGLHQYTDFYSYHLPLYFQMPLFGEGLAFVWWLRATTLISVVVYALVTKPRQWPFVLMFVTYGRMAEIRPDTFGLLLFNLGWWLLLQRKSVALASSLAALALLFSARAAVMVVPFGLLCLHLASAQERRRLMALTVLFIFGLALAYASDPHLFVTIIRSVYLDPVQKFHMGLAERFGSFDRLVLLTLMVVALIAARRSLIVVVAIGSQFALLLIDPSPYGYAFGWAMIPTVAAIGTIPLIEVAAAALAFLVFAACMLRPAGPGYATHLVMERPIQADLTAWPTPRLLAAMTKRQEIWNELKLREEVCKRFRTVAADFRYQPICLFDAYYEWVGLDWTAEQVKRWPHPDLIVWGDMSYPKAGLAGYSVYDGFAIRQPSEPPADRTARAEPDGSTMPQ